MVSIIINNVVVVLFAIRIASGLCSYVLFQLLSIHHLTINVGGLELSIPDVVEVSLDEVGVEDGEVGNLTYRD